MNSKNIWYSETYIFGLAEMATDMVERHDMDYVLLDSMDQALTNLFGPRAKQAFYSYFEEKFGFTRESIMLRLDKFLVALSETFGVTAVLVLGRTIARRLYSNLGLPFKEQPTYTLLDYVKEAKMILRLSEFDPSNVTGRIDQFQVMQ